MREGCREVELPTRGKGGVFGSARGWLLRVAGVWRAAPDAAVGILALDLAFPGVEHDVAALEVVVTPRLRARFVHFALEPYWRPTTAHDRVGLLEDEILAEVILGVARMQPREHPASAAQR